MKINNEIAEFLGWYFGDGCISTKGNRHQFTLTGDINEEHYFYNEVVLPSFNNMFSTILSKNITIRKYPSVGVCGIYLFEKKFIKFLLDNLKLKSGKKIDVRIPTFSTKEQKICFLRGLFDTDGSIYFCRSNHKPKNFSFYNTFHYKPKIKLATISETIIMTAFNLLKELGFTSRLYLPRRQKPKENIMYAVVLDTYQNTDKWINEIGFKNLKHKTKIDLWRKFGFVPPKTNIKQRLLMLNEELNPLDFYDVKFPLENIKKGLARTS